MSQTTVYDTCGSAPPASQQRMAPSRWTCSASRCRAAGVRADRSGARQLRARVPGGRRARRLENSTGRGAPRWPRVGGGRCCSQSRRCSDARPRRCGSGCGKRSVMLGTRVLSCRVSLHLHESEQFTRHLCPSGFCTGSGACDAYAAGRGGLGACLLPASLCLTGQRLPRRDWARPRRSANSRP